MVKKTVSILIGNSDDKLTQERWVEFCRETDAVVTANRTRIHFSGHSNPTKPWQNACWCFTIREEWIPNIRLKLIALAFDFKQDQIALVIGETELVGP
jgi:hypothetical protein